MATTIRMARDVEGTRHDPYEVIEREVKRFGVTIMLHEGLTEFCRVTGTPDDRGIAANWAGVNARTMFEAFSGMTVPMFDRAYDRIHNTCPTCGNRHLDMLGGMPGETFNVCPRCDRVVSTDFSLASIM